MLECFEINLLLCDLFIFKCKASSFVFFLEGLNADSIRQASEQLKSRWIEFCQLLSERLAWLEYQNNIIDFYGQLQRLEQTAITAENWLKAQPAPATDPATVKAQLEKCKVRNSILLYCTSCLYQQVATLSPTIFEYKSGNWTPYVSKKIIENTYSRKGRNGK